MNKNLLIKIGTAMELGGILTLMGSGLYAIKQWSKAERELKDAKNTIVACCIAGTVIMEENKKLNKELEELKAEKSKVRK